MAIKGFKERPILGWGQENFNIVFNKHYNPLMDQEQWFDRTHNIILDWLIAAGILGALSYLSLFVAVLVLIWRRGTFTFVEKSILTGLFAAYFFHNMFVFDNLADVDDRGIQALMREVSSDVLVLALKGADEAIKEKVFKNMSKRAAELLRDDLEAKGPVRVSDVETAQKEILTIARRMAEAGEIVLGGKGGEEMV